MDLFDSPREHHRLFLALWPGEDVRAAAQAACARLQADASGGRAVNPARYHVTLQYFGDYDSPPERLVADVRNAVDAAVAGSMPVTTFAMPLARFGRFGSVGWLGPLEAPPALTALWETLERRLAAAGVRTRNAPRFVPHLTILRDLRDGPREQPIEPVPWQVDRVVLIDSRQSGNASLRYDILQSWHLAGGS